MAICLILYGCATPIHVQRGMFYFEDNPEKLPLKAGLYLDDKERNYDIPVLLGGKFMIGEALELAATESLGKVFPTISLFNEKGKVTPDIERIIAIKFGPETSASTSFKPGLLKHEVKREAKTELFCEVYDKEWNLLWKETVIGNATLEYQKSAWGGMGGAMGGYAAGLQNESEMRYIVTKSLVRALEQLNDKILTSGKVYYSKAVLAALEEKKKREEEEKRKTEEELKLPLEKRIIFVKGGCFQMGNIFGDGGGNEQPAHEVCVDDFYMGKYEVTQKEWTEVMGNNPSYFKNCGDNCPVENVSWNDVQEYINKLNSKTGKNYRLPTEAEWEYAARSGGKNEKYAGGNYINSVAWYSNNSGDKTHPVGQKQPNGLGIYDMSGNVREWVQDWYKNNYYKNSPRNNPRGPDSGQARVLRGGSWQDIPQLLRASSSWSLLAHPATWSKDFGFRLSVSAQ